jgi:hypothetical protein
MNVPKNIPNRVNMPTILLYLILLTRVMVDPGGKNIK